MFNFLTPQFFDFLVWAFTIVGLILAARRIYQDFQRGPRWPETPGDDESAPVNSSGEPNA